MKLRLFLVLIISALSACGGGGGGGGSGDSSTSQSLPKTGIRVIHGSLDAPPLDVLASGLSKSVKFGATSGYGSTGAGLINVILKKSHTEEILSNPTVDVDEGTRKTILYTGDYRNSSVTTYELLDSPGELKAGFSKVRIINAVQGLRGFEGKIASSGGEIISLGSATEYFEVPSGAVSFSAISQLGGVASGSVTVEEKKPYSILVTGEWGYFITTSLLIG